MFCKNLTQWLERWLPPMVWTNLFHDRPFYSTGWLSWRDYRCNTWPRLGGHEDSRSSVFFQKWSVVFPTPRVSEPLFILVTALTYRHNCIDSIVFECFPSILCMRTVMFVVQKTKLPHEIRFENFRTNFDWSKIVRSDVKSAQLYSCRNSYYRLYNL